MTNGELFKKENPNIEVKINGSCVWIYYFDGVNHYTIPTEWWNKEIGLFEDIKADIDSHCSDNRDRNDGLYIAMKIIDKHIREDGE